VSRARCMRQKKRVHARLRRAMAVVHRRTGTPLNATPNGPPDQQRTAARCAAPGGTLGPREFSDAADAWQNCRIRHRAVGVRIFDAETATKPSNVKSSDAAMDELAGVRGTPSLGTAGAVPGLA